MRVWVFESNLMWSARLVQSVKGLGHEPKLVERVPEEAAEGDVAIVNLGSPGVGDTVALLKARGVVTIGHAGHKEKDLLQLGREAGVERLASNGELTFKLGQILEEVSTPPAGAS